MFFLTLAALWPVWLLLAVLVAFDRKVDTRA